LDTGEISPVPAVVVNVVSIPCYVCFLQEYLPSCRPREGVDSIPDGAEFYMKCLRWHTSLDLSPRQVHDIGLAEVERIRQEMTRVFIQIYPVFHSIY
jgi:uncharacterized protein (DUF885 family)